MYHCKAIEKIESIQKIALKNNEIPKDILLKQNQLRMQLLKHRHKKKEMFFIKHLFISWDTRTRTKNDRTRICCVTITPYPKKHPLTGFACAKVVYFL